MAEVFFIENQIQEELMYSDEGPLLRWPVGRRKVANRSNYPG